MAVVVAVALLAGVLAAPMPGEAADSMTMYTASAGAGSARTARLAVGTQFHGTWAELSDADRARMLDAVVDSGATWVRMDLGWSTIQPLGRGSYDLVWGVPFVDKVLNMAHRRGLKVLATFWLTPGWANRHRGDRVLPTRPGDYAAALKWSAARWRTQVQAWEIWNEPNATSSLRPSNPRAYTRLLRAAYPAVHAGSPRAKVVFGGTMYVDTRWISRAYAAGARGAFDVMAVHAYQGHASYGPEAADHGRRERITHTAALIALMRSEGDRSVPIWYTEFGWSTHANTRATPVWKRGVSETVQARFLTRTLAMVQHRYPQVTHVFWYTSRDLTDGTRQHNNRGLIRRDWTPKPALAALKCYTRRQRFHCAG